MRVEVDPCLDECPRELAGVVGGALERQLMGEDVGLDVGGGGGQGASSLCGSAELRSQRATGCVFLP